MTKRYIRWFIWIGFILLGIYLFLNWKCILRKDVIIIVMGYFSFIIAIETYLWQKSVEMSRFATEKKYEFINNKTFTDIERRIEHNDPELLCLVAAYNTNEFRNVKLCPQGPPSSLLKLQQLHQDFDNYLNWIESFAILFENHMIEKYELEGLWDYYLCSLRDAGLDDETMKEFYIKAVWFHEDFDSFSKRLRQENVARSSGKSNYEPVECCICNARECNCIIDPVNNPLWWYIHNPEFKFKLLKLAKYCYQNFDWDKCSHGQKNIVGRSMPKRST